MAATQARTNGGACHTSGCHGSSYLVCQCESGLGERSETLHLKLHLTDRRVKADAATPTQTIVLLCACSWFTSHTTTAHRNVQSVSQWLVASTVCAGTNLNLCVWPLTFAEVDRHALRLEQAVVLILGVALGQLRGVARWGLSQRVRQGGRGRRCRGSWRGGGRGGVYLAVDWRDVAWAARYGWSDELPAKAEQAAGDFVDVEGGSFCTGARAGRTKVCEGKNERQKPTDRRVSVGCTGWIFSSNNSPLFVDKLLPNRITSIQNEAQTADFKLNMFHHSELFDLYALLASAAWEEYPTVHQRTFLLFCSINFWRSAVRKSIWHDTQNPNMDTVETSCEIDHFLHSRVVAGTLSKSWMSQISVPVCTKPAFKGLPVYKSISVHNNITLT